MCNGNVIAGGKGAVCVTVMWSSSLCFCLPMRAGCADEAASDGNVHNASCMISSQTVAASSTKTRIGLLSCCLPGHVNINESFQIRPGCAAK